MKNILSLFFALLVSFSVHAQDFMPLTSGVTATLGSISFMDDDIGLSVGVGGVILKTTTGGITWASQPSGVTTDLSEVVFEDATTAYVVGAAGVILKSTDAGCTWSLLNSGTSTTLTKISINGSDIYVTGYSGILLKSSTQGATWTSLNTTSTTFLYGNFFTSATTGYIVGHLGTILKTTDGGGTWSAQVSGTTLQLLDVFFTDTNNGYAVGGDIPTNTGIILKTSDAGINWTSQAIPNNYFGNVRFLDSLTGYISGGDILADTSTILKTEDAGVTWVLQSSASSRQFGASFPSFNAGYTCGLNGSILKTECTCGTYSDMTYRPYQGAPNVNVACGDTLVAQCIGEIPWTLGGSFLCDGGICSDSVEMYWTLYDPAGVASSDTMTADSFFNLTIPASEFDTTGTYSLFMNAICGSDTCTCFFTIDVLCNYCVCPLEGIAAPNLVTNGDFSSGDSSFGSDLPSSCLCLADSYCVGANLQDKCPQWPDVYDHTTGNPTGSFLMVDGDPVDPATVWSQEVDIIPCMVYCFSFWTTSVYPPNFQDFDLDIVVYDLNGSVTPAVGTANIVQTDSLWDNHFFTWTAPCDIVGPYTLAIEQIVGSHFTDFGIDDICFTKSKLDSCGFDFIAFCAAAEEAITTIVDSTICKTTAHFCDLPCNSFVDWTDWGDGSVDSTDYHNNNMAMHVYPDSGTYVISWLIIEKDSSGFICFEKTVTDTITINCDHVLVQDCDSTIVLTSPDDDFFFGDNLRYETDQNISISSLLGSGADIILDAKNGTLIGPGFSMSAGALLSIYTDGCEPIDTVPFCATCRCGGFSDMFIRTGGAPSLPVFCDTTALALSCPNPGFGYSLTGAFGCEGDDCPGESLIQWDLTGPGVSHSDSFLIQDPFWGINLLPTYFTQPGLYTLTLTGHCGEEECTCVLRFNVDCPPLCPCELEDLQAFIDAVDMGFANVLPSSNCQACFAPLALSDCETVEWYIGTTNGPLAGSTVGNQTFCTNFVTPGTYTVIMVVTRLKPDSTFCEILTKSQTVTITCTPIPNCNSTAFANPEFGEGAVSGGLRQGSGGMSNGWTAASGNPIVVEGAAGSSDAWTIQLSGNLDTSDVLTTLDTICMVKDTGMVTVRLSDRGIKENGLKSAISFQLYSGDELPGPDSSGYWSPIRCLRLASIDLTPLVTGEWYDVQIPYDIRDWMAVDTCGNGAGVLVRPAISVDNGLGNNQGMGDNRSEVQIDKFCFEANVISAKK